MRIYGRKLTLKKLSDTIILFFKILRVCKNPIKILIHYIFRTSPEKIMLRNGLALKMGEHAHDLITFVVVFIKEDYGIVSEGGVVIDIGANIGMFSIFAASSKAKKVYAFEPNPNSYRTLKENITANGFNDIIVPINKAVTDTCETVFIPSASSPHNQVVKDISEYSDNRTLVKVATTTLERFIKDQKISKISLLKLDCEGSEYQIIDSASPNILKKINTIRMEVHGDKDKLIKLFRAPIFYEKKWSKGKRLNSLAGLKGLSSDLWLERKDL